MQLRPSEIGPAIAQASQLQRAGHAAQAEQLCRAVLDARPDEADALHILGICLQQRGRYAEAEQAQAASLRSRPKHPGALTHRGIALQALQRYEEALRCYDEAAATGSDDGLLYWNRALTRAALGHDRGALGDFERASSTLGSQKGLQSDWLAAADRVLAVAPDDREALASRALALVHQGQWPEALAAYEVLLHRHGDDREARAAMAGVLLRLDRPDEALAACEAVLQAEPTYLIALNNKALALAGLGKYAEAVETLDRLIRADPNNPTAQCNRGACLLVQGHFDEGWRGFEWRWQRSPFLASLKAMPEPLWDGRLEIAGRTLLLHAEQGFGDTIQFARYAPLLAERGARVIIGAHRPLKPLLETVAGVSAVIASGDEMPRFDLHCALMSLPALLGTSIETIPATVPYVRTDSARRERWAARLGPRIRPRIGLTWSGNPRQDDDIRRSMRLSQLAPLLSLPAEFICLNKNVRDVDRADLLRFGIRHYGEEQTDFAETAALMSHMDLVISTDTSIAHLAGALALPVWLMLAYKADFRWLLERDDSPWYPTARLFRQPRRGDWQAVVEHIAQELPSHFRQHGATSRPVAARF